MPNIKTDLFMLVPNERRQKIASEIHRPTFARQSPPLPRIYRLRPPLPGRGSRRSSHSGGEIRYMKQEVISERARKELRAELLQKVLATVKDSYDKN